MWKRLYKTFDGMYEIEGVLDSCTGVPVDLQRDFESQLDRVLYSVLSNFLLPPLIYGLE